MTTRTLLNKIREILQSYPEFKMYAVRVSSSRVHLFKEGDIPEIFRERKISFQERLYDLTRNTGYAYSIDPTAGPEDPYIQIYKTE